MNFEEVLNYKKTYSEDQIDAITSEFARLNDTCYLDHAGTTLYSETQIKHVFDDINTNVYGNPHSKNTCSRLTEDAVDQIRYDILKFFGTNDQEYSIIFTASATAALKILAESFYFGNEGVFAYLQDNHTSVLGMREYANKCVAFSTDSAFELFSEAIPLNSWGETNNLFVYPAQSNFSGTKYPLSWIQKVQQGNLSTHGIGKWYCALDAASYVSSNTLDLSSYKPDFIPISFYKIFGYPTGLGALLVRNSSSHVLSKRYYGGGTIFLAASMENVVVRRKILHENFEDGTLPFLSILSLRHGLDTLKRLSLSMNVISHHVFSLARYVYCNLLSYHHSNGQPVAILYHHTVFDAVKTQGGIVNFNLLRSNGETVGYSEVLNICNLYNIHVRTGCFCNPGACQDHLQLTDEDIKHHYNQGHVCGDQNDLIEGVPTGSIRVSFGYMSTKDEADKLLQIIVRCFVEKPVIRKWNAIKNPNRKFANHFKSDQNQNSLSKQLKPDDCIKNSANATAEIIESNVSSCESSKCNDHAGILEEIFIYPIKSCAAFPVSNWELAPTGLKYDREWMITNSSGVCMTQKKDTYMCLIKPRINLKKDVLELHFEGVPSISLPLDVKEYKTQAFACQSKVCGDRVEAWDCGNEVSYWLSEALSTSGLRLVRQCVVEDLSSRNRKKGTKLQLSLTNQAQFLLINSASVQWLQGCIPSEVVEDRQSLINRFRPNFVVRFSRAFAENTFAEMRIGNLSLMNDGACTRCQMICVDQSSGEKSAEPLLTLSREFNGKISFGVYLRQNNSISCDRIEVGSSVIV